MPPHLVVASEALADGTLTRRDLTRHYTKLHRNVHHRNSVELTARDRACAAWLWSGRRAILVGYSAAVMLGDPYIDADAPVEIAHTRRPAPRGIRVYSGQLAGDEVCAVGPVNCTTVARTAYDFGRRLPLDAAVIRIDALLNATRGRVEDVYTIAERYSGARGIRRLRTALKLVDAGAESPQETRLRLLLIRSGLERPETQIPVLNQRGTVVRRIDMGWPQWTVGVEYDGVQHWTDPRRHAGDIERLEFLAAKGWDIVRVSAMQLRYHPETVIARVRKALHRAGAL